MEHHGEASHSGFMVRINGEEINFEADRATGAEVKTHARRHGLEIREDFELSEETGNGSKKHIADTEIVELRHGLVLLAVPPLLEIRVNDTSVKFHRHRATGMEIKETSIEQGLPIQKNFRLVEVHEGREIDVADEEIIELHRREVFLALASEVSILVNKKVVKLSGHHANGLEIKQAAIAEGVSIKLDFNLFKIKEDGSLSPVQDHEKIRLHDGEKFSATAPDDSSDGR
jgi:hypothetical protein